MLPRVSSYRLAHSVLLALTDFPFWKSLKDAGLSDAAATDKVVELVRTELRKHGIN